MESKLWVPNIDDLQGFSDEIKKIFIPDLDIYDCIANIENVKIAHKFARKRKSKYKCVKKVDQNPKILENLAQALKNETYKIGPYKVENLKDRKKERTLLKLEYPDRIVQWAIMLHLELPFMRAFHPFSCASIKERGIDRAFNYTKSLVDMPEYSHILKIDIEKFFQSIDHEILKTRLLEIPEIRNSQRTQNLIFHIIDSTNGIKGSGLETHKGVPIGSYVSQYFANLYLTPLDNFLESQDFKFVRYMDDVIIFGKPKELCELKYFLRDSFVPSLKLNLKHNYQVYNIDAEGIDFVGYRFYRNYQKIRKSTAYRARKNLNSKNAPSYYGIAKRSKSRGLIEKYFDFGFVKKFLEPAKFHYSEKLQIPSLADSKQKILSNHTPMF